MKKVFIYSFIILVSLLNFSCYKGSIKYYPAPLPVTVSPARFTTVGHYFYEISDHWLRIWDISNPAYPLHEADKDMANKLISIGNLHDSLLTIGILDGSKPNVYIFDVSQSYMPSLPINYNSIYATDYLALSKNFLFISTGNIPSNYNIPVRKKLTVSDFSYITNHQDFNKKSDSNSNLAVSGNYLFLCDSGLSVYDVSVKPDIKIRHHFNIEANDIAAENNNLFIKGMSGIYLYTYENDTIALKSKISFY